MTTASNSAHDLNSAFHLRPSNVSEPKPMILVLDLDETLLRPKIQRAHDKRKLSRIDLQVYLEGGIRCSASFRPGLDEFFYWIRERRDAGLIEGPWIFGQGARIYVEAMVRQLDPFGDLFGSRILCKESCTAMAWPWSWVLKDLSKIPSSQPDAAGFADDSLKRTILVDNNTISCILCPNNSLLVRDWLGDGSEDEELARASRLLDDLLAREAKAPTHGDYSSHLVSATPGHAEFCRRLAALHSRFNDKDWPPRDMPFNDACKEVWQEACDAKRALLGLCPGEV